MFAALRDLQRAPFVASVSAESFVKSIRALAASSESILPVADIEVLGSVDLSRLELPHGILLERVYFRDVVRLNNARFRDSICFKNCAFDQSIRFENSTFENGLSIQKCTFGREHTSFEKIGLSLDGAKITGNMSLVECEIHGSITARRSIHSGNVDFTGCTVEGRTVEAVVDFSDCRIAGSANFEDGQPSADSAKDVVADILKKTPGSASRWLCRSLFANRMSGSSSISFDGSEVTYIHLSNARFVGSINLANTKTAGLTSDAGWFACRPDEPAQRTVAAGETARNFGGARIEAGGLDLSGGGFGLVRLKGIGIDGDMMLIDGKSGQIEIGDDVGDGDQGEVIVAPSRIGNFFMSGWHCRDFIRLHMGEVAGAVNESGAHGIGIMSSTIDGAVSLWPGQALSEIWQSYLEQGAEHQLTPEVCVVTREGELKYLGSNPDDKKLLNRWQRGMRVRGDIRIDRSNIGGAFDLTGVQVDRLDPGDERGLGGGRIQIVQSEVRGRVGFESPASYLENPKAENPKAENPISRLGAQFIVAHDIVSRTPPTPMVAHTFTARAECDAISLTGLRAAAVELSGLQLRAPVEEESRASSGWFVRLTALMRRSWSGMLALGRSRPDRPGHERFEQKRTQLQRDDTGHAGLDHMHIEGAVSTVARLGERTIRVAYEQMKALAASSSIDAAPRPVAEAFRHAPHGPQTDWRRSLILLWFGEEALSSFEDKSRNPDFSNEPLTANAIIPRALDLQYSEIRELLICNGSFRRAHARVKASEDGIVLDYARINKLYVARGGPESKATKRHNGFPVPLSLLDLTVSSWYLETGDELELRERGYIDREATESGPYLDLLDNDPVFRLSSYLAVEKSLRDRGLADEAIRIFVASRYREVRSEQSHGSSKHNPWARIWRVLSWLDWRPGDGRYRQSAFEWRRGWLIGLAYTAVLCGWGYEFSLQISPWSKENLEKIAIGMLVGAFVVTLGLALRVDIFRLRRPLHEYIAYILSISWLGFVVYFGAKLAAQASDKAPREESLIWYFLGVLALFVPLRGALRRSVDQLHWSLVGYGRNALRLLVVIGFLATFSFVFISGERENFEPTLLAETLDVHRHVLLAASGAPASLESGHESETNSAFASEMSKFDDSKIPRVESWTLGERLWIVLRYHMPLVGAVISEEWQPSDRPLHIAGLTTFKGKERSPEWWPFAESHWPRARDWFASMLWINWVLWPLLLPFLIRKLTRAD